ncbi:Phage terminase, large subunit GpA [Chelatococcus sambhunathii]|uniref:Phage terminase, large subunit GpA n=1 Tax=Chelatococcus sambhunathii TaxID=363953 RepID=A0ABM9U9M2_9HYPH|nr:terminase gpA endonuclease subunit [Chelatococcus sambhunathii]CUA90901.1 Phage terminase, large subunit GpA [Chelatococcus sambhunathii]
MATARILIRPTTRQTPDEWGADNRVYPPTSGVPGERNPYLTPYMVPFGRAVASGRYKRVVAVTCAQAGKTESFLDIIGQRLDQRPAPILYVGPSKEFLTDQFEPRLMELFDQAKTLAAKVSRGKANKKTLKRVAGVRVRLAHAGSSTALKSDPAALAVVDEFDEMLANIKGQGDPLGLVEARGDTFADFTTAVTSTCSRGLCETEVDENGLEFWKVMEPDQIESPIWRLFQEGTRYHWAWPCLHCGEYFIPRSKLLRYPDGATPAEARRNTHLACPRCGGLHVDDDKAKMNERGLFVAPGQWIENGVVYGDPPDSSTWSMWASGLASPFVTWGDRVERYLKAVASGEDDKVQTAINAGFGELYATGGGGDLPEWEEVRARVVPYQSGEVPRRVVRLMCGVDVGKRTLHYVIRGFGSQASSWLIKAGIFYGLTAEDEVWEKLEQMLLTPIGGLYIERMMIDAGYRPDKKAAGDEHRVYRFAMKFPRLVSSTKGHDTQSQPVNVAMIEKDSSGKKLSRSVELVHVNTDFFKTMVHDRLRTPVGRPGAFYLPEDVDDDYGKQLLSEARIIAPNGKPKWIKRYRENHWFDCEVLAAVAGFLAGVHRLPAGIVREEGADLDQEIGVAAEGDAADAAPTPAAAPATVRSIRDRFANMSARLNNR